MLFLKYRLLISNIDKKYMFLFEYIVFILDVVYFYKFFELVL